MSNVELFWYVLPYIGKGMLGIFAVTLLLLLSIVLLNKFSANRKED